MTEKEKNKQRVLNGGRGGGQAYRGLFEYYENKVYVLNERITELEAYNEKLLNSDIEKHNKIVMLEKENAELKEENEQLREQIEYLQIMLQAEREVRCNDEYLKKVTELEDKIEKMNGYMKELFSYYDDYGCDIPTINKARKYLETGVAE